MANHFNLRPVGTIRSCFKERFGIPRQPGLAPDARAVIELDPALCSADCVRGLEEFSHVWVVFVFHGVIEEGWNPLVRPPRLGGTKKIGVFASRSPHRPNPIGLSAVPLERIETLPDGRVRLHVRGGDFLDGTPVLDLKPYIPYGDSIPSASSGWATGAPRPRLKVEFVEEAERFCAEADPDGKLEVRKLIEEVLALDPRPAFQVKASQEPAPQEPADYGMKLLDFDVHWQHLSEDICRVTRVVRV